MIRRCEYELVAGAIRRSGVAVEIERLLVPDGRGRPRALSVEAFLTAAVLTAQRSLPLNLTNIHATLTRELSLSLQVAIGVRVKSGRADVSQPISIRQVRYVLEAIERRLVYSEASAPELSDGLRESRRGRFEGIIDKLIASTVPASYSRTVSVAIDGSGIESFGKSKWREVSLDQLAAGDPAEGEGSDGPRDGEVPSRPAAQERERYSADPDARAGYRTKTYDSKSNHNFGYDLTAFVAVPRVNGPDIGPKLLIGMRVLPAAQSVTAPAIDLLDRLAEEGYDIDDVIADRGYSHKRPEDWAEQLLARGINQVQDIHPADHGPRDADGVLVIDGVPHCESTPGRLLNLSRPVQLSAGRLKANATEAERAVHERLVKAIEEFNADIAERQQYASVVNQYAKDGAKDPGKAQWICGGRAGKLKCSSCPMYEFFSDDLPVIEDPPSGQDAPRACRQATAMVAGAALVKLRQPDYWGSLEWQASYGRRAFVESIFGNWRNPSTQNIRRGFCRVMGLIKTTLMLAFEAMAANLRLVRAWARLTGENSDPLHEPFPENFGFEELDAEGNARPCTSGSGSGPPDE